MERTLDAVYALSRDILGESGNPLADYDRTILRAVERVRLSGLISSAGGLQLQSVGDGITDALPAFQAAVAATPTGGVLYVPPGTYLLSNTLACPRPILILGGGTGVARTVLVSPSAAFPAGADFLTITGGYSSVINIASNMNRRGGNWLTFIGEGGSNQVERCWVTGVAAGSWGIELRDAGGTNGIALTNIDANTFVDFDGGGVWGNGGGDSCCITRNVFQLVASTSHLIKWSGPAGAACLYVAHNNLTGAAKFVQFDTATQFKFIGNQCEATTPLTSTEGAMIVVNGPAAGFTIADNNLNGTALNAAVGIYLSNAQDGYVLNNSIAGVTHYLKTAGAAARITYHRGTDAGTLDDPDEAVSIWDGPGTSALHGDFTVVGAGSSLGVRRTLAAQVAFTVVGESYLGAEPAAGIAWLPAVGSKNVVVHTNTAPAANTGSVIGLAGRYRAADNAAVAYGSIAGLKENASDSDLDGFLAFYTAKTTIGGSTERLRLTSTGDLKLPTAAKGVILTNAAGSVTKRVRLNDVGDGLIFEAP